MITTTFPGSWIHRFDIRTKLSGFLAITVLMFLFDNPLYNLGIVLLLFLLIFIAKLPGKAIKSLLTPLSPILIFIMLFTALMTPLERFQIASHREVLFSILPPIHLTRGGILLGFTYLSRILVMVLASSLLMFTSTLEELIQLFQKFHLSYEVSFLITTAIRFIPTLNRKKAMIIDAMQARGAHPGGKNIIGQFKAQIPIMIPLIINSILMADTLSISMLNRGFGYAKTWTNLQELSFTAKDFWAISVILILVSLGFFTRIYLHQGLL